MPVKRRVAKLSEHRITPEAVAAFRRGDWMELHRLLGLRPWHPSPLDAYDPDPPAWAGPGDAWREFWPLARDLRAKLSASPSQRKA